MTTTSPSFIGFVPNTSHGTTFLSDLRKVFRGTGMKVIRYARNPNRKQFYQNYIYSSGRKHYYCQNLPLQYATHYALYVRDSKGDTLRGQEVMEIRAKTIFNTVKKIYSLNKINLDIVPNYKNSVNYLPKK